MPKWEQTQNEGIAALSDPRLSNPAKMRKKYCLVNIAVRPCLQLISHTQETSPFRKWSVRDYIFIKKCVRSFIEVRKLCLIMFPLVFVLRLYNTVSPVARETRIQSQVESYQKLKT